MVASEFPRRLYTKGGEPAPDKSIGYYADDYRLVPALRSALQEDEWEEIYESPLGVFLKFHDLDFGWASRLVHHMLTFQIVCKQRYEIWSLIGTTPVQFLLHEFEEITGLNCGYVDDLAVTDLELSDDMQAFWELMGVDVESGPSTIEIIEACSNCSSWSRDDRLWLGYLGIYAGFIVATRPGLSTNVNHARLVMDLEGFKKFPWGRIGFQHLIKSVKEKYLSKNIHIEGFVQALQVWVYYALPNFAAEFGEPLPNDPTPLLLAYKGSRGRQNARIQCCVAKDLADMFTVWDDEEQDPDIVKIVNAIHDPHFKFSKKPLAFGSFSTKMLNGLGSCEKQIKLLTDKVESVERAVEELTTGSAKHTEEEVKDNVQPTQQQVTGSKKHEGCQGEAYDSNELFESKPHIEAYINVLRLRLSKHPEWFVSDRICFLNSIFATICRRDYNDFKNSEPNEDGSGKLLPGAYSYYTGELSIYCQTKKTWAYEVDHLYLMLHIRGDHWVAIWVSFVTRHITIWDSHAGTKHASDAQIDEAVEPLAVMIPYLLQTCAPDEDKWRFPYTPFTHLRVPGTEIPQNIQSSDCGVYCLKYIECHALDLPFPPQLFDKNIRQIREKMAAEIFDEISARGHDKLDATGLDVYDRKV
ncbi:hypothetical protein EUTSA_v10012042mg [Eutrema salsugineum]|uniref:Ubiquitin-like protease family profile domain-containing protein n=1 Tax=Eutrema salsugineum TaxID=72664 RepID=V4MHK5_EUTSA|nr:hypothetical protein EUTSA_v10012042mg [Eutrema salsugineum]